MVLRQAAGLMTAGGIATPAGACGIVGGMTGCRHVSTPWPSMSTSEHTAYQAQSKVAHFVKYRYTQVHKGDAYVS